MNRKTVLVITPEEARDALAKHYAHLLAVSEQATYALSREGNLQLYNTDNNVADEAISIKFKELNVGEPLAREHKVDLVAIHRKDDTYKMVWDVDDVPAEMRGDCAMEALPMVMQTAEPVVGWKQDVVEIPEPGAICLGLDPVTGFKVTLFANPNGYSVARPRSNKASIIKTHRWYEYLYNDTYWYDTACHYKTEQEARGVYQKYLDLRCKAVMNELLLKG